MNVALLGHVDAGKTTLARALTEVASTGAFNHAEDRHNTVDLGYSSLEVAGRRVCLIDCPGHAGLIRAVVAASAVIDAAIVVVSAIKGVEAQTAEHLLLASLCCRRDRLIVVLTKRDIATEEQLVAAEKSVRRAFKTLGIEETPRMRRVDLLQSAEAAVAEVKEELEQCLLEDASQPSTSSRGADTAGEHDLLVAVDHCFAVKGKGTVLTGSVLQGRVSVGSEVELPHLRERRRIRELQSWKESKQEVGSGERVAMLVAALPSPVARCLIGSPGVLQPLTLVAASVTTIPFFRFPIKDGAKVHVSCGYETEIATVRFGRRERNDAEGCLELLPQLAAPCEALITFARPIFSPLGSFYVASRLELQAKGCRFAFHGRMERAVEKPQRYYTRQRRVGEVERAAPDCRSVIVKSMFKKESKQSLFTGMQVVLATGERGRIEGPFGASGKTRVGFDKALPSETQKRIAAATAEQPVKMYLYLKKFHDDKSLRSYVPDRVEEAEREEVG